MELLRQHVNGGQVIFNEFANMFKPTQTSTTQVVSSPKKVILQGSGITASDNTDTPKKLALPAVELFASVSDICIFISHKEFKQPLLSSIYPLIMFDLKQPTINLSSIKECKLDVKLLGIDVLSCSLSNGIHRDSHIPSRHDFDIDLLKSGQRSPSDPVSGFFNMSLLLRERLACSIDIELKKPLFLSYKLTPTNNIELCYKKIKNALLTNLEENGEISYSEEHGPTESSVGFSVKIDDIKISTKRFCFLSSVSTIEPYTVLAIQFESFSSNTTCSYEGTSQYPSNIKSSNLIKLLEMYLTQEKRYNLLTPMNARMNLAAFMYQGNR